MPKRQLVLAVLFASLLAATPTWGDTAPDMSTALADHWVSAHVVLESPIPIEGEAGSATGYYRNFGVSCAPERLRAVVESHVSDGSVDWRDSEVSAVDPASLDAEIQALMVPVSGEGVWYESGRAFYGAE